MIALLAVLASVIPLSLAQVSTYSTWQPEMRKGFQIRGLTDEVSVDNAWNGFSASHGSWAKGVFGVVPGTIFKINEPSSPSRTHIRFEKIVTTENRKKEMHTKLVFHKGKWDPQTNKWTDASRSKVREFKMPQGGWPDPDQLPAYLMSQKAGKWVAVKWFNSKKSATANKDTGFTECLGWTRGNKPIVPKGKTNQFQGAQEYFNVDYYDYDEDDYDGDYYYDEDYDEKYEEEGYEGGYYDDDAYYDNLYEIGRMEEALLRRLNRMEMMRRNLDRFNY